MTSIFRVVFFIFEEVFLPILIEGKRSFHTQFVPHPHGDIEYFGRFLFKKHGQQPTEIDMLAKMDPMSFYTGAEAFCMFQDV
jgi:hypothetical protein